MGVASGKKRCKQFNIPSVSWEKSKALYEMPHWWGGVASDLEHQKDTGYPGNRDTKHLKWGTKNFPLIER